MDRLPAQGLPLPFMADAVAPAIVAAQAIGRLGNYFNQELYGGPTNLPWGLEIFQRVNQTTGLPDNLDGVAVNTSQFQVVHPTFLYELIWDLLVALMVVLLDRRLRLGHGRAFALYVAGYAFGRFWIELMRSDPATMIFHVRVNVWMMSLLFLCGVAYFVLARRRGPREDPATFPGRLLPESTVDATGDPEEPSSATDDVPATGSPAAESPATESAPAESPATESAATGSAATGSAATGSSATTEEPAEAETKQEDKEQAEATAKD